MIPRAGTAFFNSTNTNDPNTACNKSFDSAKNPSKGPNIELTIDKPPCAISPKAAPSLT